MPAVNLDPRGRPLPAHHRGWHGPWSAPCSSPSFSMAHAEGCLRNPPVSLRVPSVVSRVRLLPTVPAFLPCPPSVTRPPPAWSVCPHHRSHSHLSRPSLMHTALGLRKGTERITLEVRGDFHLVSLFSFSVDFEGRCF